MTPAVILYPLEIDVRPPSRISIRPWSYAFLGNDQNANGVEAQL
jgi:hypothetical protein